MIAPVDGAGAEGIKALRGDLQIGVFVAGRRRGGGREIPAAGDGGQPQRQRGKIYQHGFDDLIQ